MLEKYNARAYSTELHSLYKIKIYTDTAFCLSTYTSKYETREMPYVIRLFVTSFYFLCLRNKWQN